MTAGGETIIVCPYCGLLHCLAKLCVLIFLLLSVQFRSVWRTRSRTTLYRLAELVCRWSMVSSISGGIAFDLPKDRPPRKGGHR